MAVVLLAAFLMIACLLALRFEKQLTAVPAVGNLYSDFNIICARIFPAAVLDRLFQHSHCGGSSFESSVFIRRKEEKAVCTAAGAVLCAVCDCCHGVADRCSASDRK